jgi:hypothetical protein
MYSDMDSHLQKLKLCFQKCKEYGISLNLKKCAFMVYLEMILSFIVSKKRETTISKQNVSNSKHATT